VEPVMIKRVNETKFYVVGLCDNCGDSKFKFFNDSELHKLPNIFFEMRIPNIAIKTYIDDDGNTHCLFPLIDSIINKS
jgi:hypothetical protein